MVSVAVDTAEAEIRRAERARVFLGDGIFQDAWAELEARILAEWQSSRPADAARREELHQLHRAMSGLENILAGYVESGAVALHRVADLERERIARDQ